MHSIHPRYRVALAGAVAVLVLSASAHADVKYRWFKNKSAVAANDFHVTKHPKSKKFNSASVTNAATGNTAWPDRSFNPNESSFEWNSASNMEPIPSGGFAKLCTEPGYPDRNSSKTYFTHNGNTLPTVGFVTEKKAKESGLAVSLDFTNENQTFPVAMESIEVLVNNSLDPHDPLFVPDGIPAIGIPQALILFPGETVSFFIPNADPGMTVYVYCDVRDAASTEDVTPNVDILGVKREIGFPYCPGLPNSTGLPARMSVWGQPFAIDNDCWLQVDDLPAGQFGYFLTSQTQGLVQPPMSAGLLCLGGNIGRLNQMDQVIQGPSAIIPIDLTAMPVNPPMPVQPGEAWHFQCWYRDGATSNFSEAVIVLFH